MIFSAVLITRLGRHAVQNQHLRFLQGDVDGVYPHSWVTWYVHVYEYRYVSMWRNDVNPAWVRARTCVMTSIVCWKTH